MCEHKFQCQSFHKNLEDTIIGTSWLQYSLSSYLRHLILCLMVIALMPADLLGHCPEVCLRWESLQFDEKFFSSTFKYSIKLWHHGLWSCLPVGRSFQIRLYLYFSSGSSNIHLLLQFCECCSLYCIVHVGNIYSNQNMHMLYNSSFEEGSQQPFAVLHGWVENCLLLKRLSVT